jgi:hypothetical protein
VRRFLFSTVLGLALCLSGARAADKEERAACGNHATAVQFVDTPSQAAREAAKEHKLVFVLHVSGLFEDPKLT